MKERTPPEPLDLNHLVSLPQEKQSISLLQFLTECESFLSNSTPEELVQTQQSLCQALLNLLSLPTPPIGHVLRNCLGRCFADIFERGDRRILFDTVSILLQKVAALKADKDAKQKHATIFCLGEILAAASDSVMQLIPEAVSTLVKIVRTSSFDSGVRAIALDSIRKTFTKHERIKDEAIAKDLIKIVRFGLADKSNILQIRAAQLLQHVSQKADFMTSQTDLENVKSLLVQTIDTPSKKVRVAAAQSLAFVLLSVMADEKQNETLTEASTREPKKKRPSAGVKPDDEDDGRASPAPGKVANAILFRLQFQEILRQLSINYARTASRYIRSGLTLSYSIIFKALGGHSASANYSAILDHLLTNVASHPLVGDDRFRALEARRHIDYLLGHVLRRQLLTEPAKMMAIRTIIDALQKKPARKSSDSDAWPIEATVAALSEVAGLIQDLGSAVSLEQESLQELFRRFIKHSNSAVQATAAWGLRSFVMAVPSQIEPMLAICKSDLNHHLDLLSDAAAPHGRFALGIAQGVSALVQICPFRPLFFSTNVIVDIWALANSLLQMSSKSDLRSSQVQIQVSWNLIGGLMAAGPQFVKSRINQLLLLWQNALPRPLPKDSMAGRNTAELQYLLHVREKALAALCLFLRYNVKLLTLDTSKRIAIMLADTNTFVGRLPSGPPPDDARMLASHSQLLDIAIKVKMRVLRCYYVFVNQDIKTIAGPELLMTAISIFVDSDPLISKSISGKSPTVGTFDSFASSTDNYGWGVSSYIRWMSTSEWNDGQTSRLHWSVWDSDSDMLEQMLAQPIIGALENDVSEMYSYGEKITEIPLPVPPATALVDAAIDLFSHMVIDQPVKIQESAFALIAASVGDGNLVRNAARKAAVINNIVIALSQALPTHAYRGFKGVNESERVRSLILEILKACVVDPDPTIRFLAGDSMGRLCSGLREVDVAKQIKFLTDSVVSNREPNSRAGFAFALGSILFYMGGMAAGLHLRTVLGLLLSLANDPHPTVHFWALEAMEKAIISSGLNFSSHVSSCLGALSQLILSDLFDPEDVVSAVSNTTLEFPTLASLGRCVDAIINVLGPDLASSKKSRVLICMLVGEMNLDADEIVATEAIHCMQHLNLFCPDAVDLQRFIRKLESNLASSVPQIRQISCEAMYGLIRKDVMSVFRLALPSLSDELWSFLNIHGHASRDVEEVIESWVEQTAVTNAKGWIDMCLKLLTHSGQKELLKGDSKGDGTVEAEFIDEAAAFSAQPANKSAADASSVEYLRWQAIAFVLHCLRRVVQLNLKEHSVQIEGLEHPLVLGVGDLIRAAFTASTSTVVDVRLGGLNLLHDLIKGLAGAIDPDFPESALLEQYQAQIGSALTPAFAVDSSPEVAAEAISICAEFISSNIVKDVDHMGRLLKILVAGLSDVEGESFIGDLKIPSTNARLMVRLSVLSAWAELQIRSTQQDYLLDIVIPHVGTLIPMWLEALSAYAKLQFEPDAGDGAIVEDLLADNQYSFASKEFLLQIYNPCWLQIINAVATLIELESEHIFWALDSNDADGGKSSSGEVQSNYRDEPVAFFFIIYGLCFQSLLRVMARDDSEARRTIPLVLDALRKFLRPSISGNAMYKSFVFAETTDLLDRLVLMENSEVQLTVIKIATNLAKYHPNAVDIQEDKRHVNGTGSSNEQDQITDGMDQLLDLMHILILALNQNTLWLSQQASHVPGHKVFESAAQALISIVEMTELFPYIIKVDLYGGIYSIYDRLLDWPEAFSEAAQVLLSSFRKFCQNLKQCIDESPVATRKLLDSAATLVVKLLNRLEIAAPSQVADFEAACFLTIVCLTTIPELADEHSLFSRFCAVLAVGLLSSEMANCARKCFRALFVSEPRLQTKWVHLAVAELIASLTVTKMGSDDIQTTEELLTTIVQAAERCDPKEVVSLMTIVLPLLSNGGDKFNQNLELQKIAASTVLSLATIDPASFKTVLGQMAVEQRMVLEALLRTAMGGTQREKRTEQVKPSISLRLDFASIE